MPREGALPDMDWIPPGPVLGMMLSSVVRSRLNGHELVELIRARSRQIAHLQAEMYADIWDLAHTPPGDVDSEPERTAWIDEYIRDEIQAALTLTERGADIVLSLALDLARLPRVREALSEGRIDLARAKVLCRETEHLDDDVAARVIEELLDDASHQTTGQLAARTRRRAIKADPDGARRRYRRGVEDRRVDTGRNPDGTADIAARQLPIDRVTAVTERIWALARSLHGEDDRSIDQIRADVVMDLLEGNPLPLAGGTRGSVELRIDLPTLAGLDDDPAEIPGWGPVISDIARQIAQCQTDCQWKAVVVDPETGQPLWTGTTRRRPTTAQRRHVEARNPTCVFPGCRRPATRSHIDHTTDHARGGTTRTSNLGPLCARHHLRSKHRAGWALRQPEPGVFHWISPRGRHYRVRPPPRD